MPSCRDQRVREPPSEICPQQRLGQPHRSVCVDEMPGLTEVGRPEDVAIRRVGSVVGHDRRGSTGPDQIDVPAKLRRNSEDSLRCCKGEVLVTVVYPLKERLPKSVGLLVVQPWND